MLRKSLLLFLGVLLAVCSFGADRVGTPEKAVPFRDHQGLLNEMGSSINHGANEASNQVNSRKHKEFGASFTEQNSRDRVRYPSILFESSGGDGGVDSEPAESAYSRWLWPVAVTLVAGGVTYGLYSIRSR